MNAFTQVQPSFWQGKRVLVTGHTGFKGSWLTLWLNSLGAKICGVGLAPESNPALFDLAAIASRCQSHILDIRNLEATMACVQSFKPDIVFHLAAQALVRQGYANPHETYSTNVMGTVNLLEAMRFCPSARTVICITTDKVYQNNEWPWPYRETDTLGGLDPYSSSKAASELVINTYRASFFAAGQALASARAGNVIGGGDWSADRLLPDAIRAWSSGQTLEIRRPDAIRPWQHVLDCLHAYLLLAEKLWGQPQLAGAYNFGPSEGDSASVKDVIQQAMQLFDPTVKTHFHPVPAGPHEAGQLRLDVSLARQQLGIQGQWNLQQALEKTLSWYKAQSSGQDAAQLCLQDIRAYGHHHEQL